MFQQWHEEDKTRPVTNAVIPTHVPVDVAPSLITLAEDQFYRDYLPLPQSKSQFVDLSDWTKRSSYIVNFISSTKATL